MKYASCKRDTFTKISTTVYTIELTDFARPEIEISLTAFGYQFPEPITLKAEDPAETPRASFEGIGLKDGYLVNAKGALYNVGDGKWHLADSNKILITPRQTGFTVFGNKYLSRIMVKNRSPLGLYSDTQRIYVSENDPKPDWIKKTADTPLGNEILHTAGTEYRKIDDSQWTLSGDSVRNLEKGRYEFRLKATENVYASESVFIDIENFGNALPEKTLTGIGVTTLPAKTQYLEEADKLDVTGGKVTLYYSNGTSEVIELNEKMVTGFDNTKIGRQTLTVTYQGRTTTFGVEIIARKPSAATEKVEQKELTEVPEALQGTRYDTVAKIREALEQKILQNLPAFAANSDKQKTILFDAQLMITENGVSRPATKAEVEARGGITIVIPYPAGTNKDDFVFTVAHMLTMDMSGMHAGDIELPEITLADAGLQVTLKGLSPVMVGYVAKAAETPATGDSFQIAVWGGLSMAAACGAAYVVLTQHRKKEQDQ